MRALEPPSEEHQPAERRPEVSNQGEADASPPLPWWQEMLKSTLPLVITPLVTAAVTGFGSILAALEGAIILAAVSFSIAVIAELVGVYLGIKRRDRRMLDEIVLDLAPLEARLRREIENAEPRQTPPASTRTSRTSQTTQS
jgi:choline-glycine betaine transporter